MTPSVQVAHLEGKSANEEEDVNGDDPDGIKGITRVHSTSHQTCLGCSTGEKVLLPFQQPRSLYL